jgi:hypothetical protein
MAEYRADVSIQVRRKIELLLKRGRRDAAAWRELERLLREARVTEAEQERYDAAWV